MTRLLEMQTRLTSSPYPSAWRRSWRGDHAGCVSSSSESARLDPDQRLSVMWDKVELAEQEGGSGPDLGAVSTLSINSYSPVSGLNRRTLSWHPNGRNIHKKYQYRWNKFLKMKLRRPDSLVSGSEAALLPGEAAPAHSFWTCPRLHLFKHQPRLAPVPLHAAKRAGINIDNPGIRFRRKRIN